MQFLQRKKHKGDCLEMSICDSGIGVKLFSQHILIEVPKIYQLIILANKLPWEKLYSLVEEDLIQSTLRKKAHYGRKLKSRIHLGIYLLQKLKDYTDREMEEALKDNAAYQVFCGLGIVDKFHCPDHTNIERFRSRLSPETQNKIANLLCKNAVELGLANTSDIDIDSTVQEANMTYPTDAKMLRKLGNIAYKVGSGLKQLMPSMKAQVIDIDIKAIATKARRCFFLNKKASKEEKSEVLSNLLETVSSPVMKVVNAVKRLSNADRDKLPWNIKKAMNQLVMYSETYFLSVKDFIATGRADLTKRLSFHLNEVGCFSKNKEHKTYEFGRAFQLIRLAGNFLFVAKSNTVRMEDKKSLLPVINEYEAFFEKTTIESIATDKGYYSSNNIKALLKKEVTDVGVQIPANIKHKNNILSDEKATMLSNRRAGIEPIIGQTKQGGQLGKSRMKNDRNTESSAYGAVLGFNLRQTIRAIINKREFDVRKKFI